jgi:RHS repeat-associated protein
MVRDSLGRVIASTDPLKRLTATQFDAMGRATKTTDPLGLSVTRIYDAEGNVTTLANAAGAATSFTYDSAGRQTALRTPGNRATAYLYENRGLVTRVTEPSGQAINNSYDDAGRLVTRSDAVGTITYSYDAKHRLLTTVEGGKTITRVYDALDRLIRFTDGNGNVLQYTYDAAGNLVSLTYPDGKVVQYGYDSANRMTQVTDWAGRITSYAYDASGRLISTTRPNGTKQLRVYSKAGELTSLRETAAGGAVIATFVMAYDAGGQISAQTRTPTPPAAVPNLVAMTYDVDDRLTTFNGSAVTFDADGNMTRGPIGAGFGDFAYDARNRLTSAGGLTYRYDAEDRRIESEEGGVKTVFVNNPNAPLWQVLTYRTGSGATTYCVYGLGLLYTEANGTPLYHHYDLRGSTVATTNSGGAVIFATSYDPYGNLVPITAGSVPTPFLFVGQYGVMADSNGFYFSRARYYNSLIHRFVNADPIRLAGGLNWFAYCGGDPLLRTDPSGLWFGVDDAIASGAGALIGLGAQGVGDLWSGKLSSWQEYTAAGIGGAAAGEATLYAGPVAGAAAGGLATNAIRQGLNLATGQQQGWDLTSTVIETGGSALAGKLGSVAAEHLASSLSNAVKGDIGGWASYFYNRLQGATLVGEEVKRAFGTRTTADFIFERNGVQYIVESKFGTSTLTAAQKAAQSVLGDAYQVERWGYDWVRRVGGNLGFGGAETGFAAARK